MFLSSPSPIHTVIYVFCLSTSLPLSSHALKTTDSHLSKYIYPGNITSRLTHFHETQSYSSLAVSIIFPSIPDPSVEPRSRLKQLSRQQEAEPTIRHPEPAFTLLTTMLVAVDFGDLQYSLGRKGWRGVTGRLS